MDSMDSTGSTTDSESISVETLLDPIRDFPPVNALGGSVLLQITTVGALLIALGALLSQGVWAAILPVWGAGLLLVGLGGYGFIWWQRR